LLGTPIKLDTKRIVINLAYKKAGCDWLTSWEAGAATHAYDKLWGLIPKLNEEQKALLGIPRQNDHYWTIQSRANYDARYNQQER